MFDRSEDFVSKYWKDNNIFKKSVDERSADNLYVFYDGPPFISGLPHYGHLLSSIAKDIIPRYWTMKGKKVERVWGWDAHGLTVENKVQKKLGIKTRRDIEKYGLEKFIQACYDYTRETSAEWNWYIDKIGRWVDMAHAYKTIDQTYMESVMWAFKQLYEKGLIYEGVRTSMFCTTCGTPVSNFEVAMDNSYKDVEDPSIIVKFKITTAGDFKDAYILAWTTTPWTIPSNRGLVVHNSEKYSLVKSDSDFYIVASKRLAFVIKGSYSVVKEFSGADLVGLEYDPPYTFYAKAPADFKVYAFDDMVSMDDGTGIVHSAPGFGEIDTKMGMIFGLSIMQTIDDEGKFLPGDAGENPYTGIYYSLANDQIRADLTSRNLLYADDRIVHRFPYHDRCDTLLIQKAQKSWFVKVSALKERMLDLNRNINWVPDHLKFGRFAQGIDQAPDWCISRSRFWATPMPVWRASDGDTLVVGSISELEELSGQKVKDLHRPYIDEIKIRKNGKVYERIPDVLDSWFEAGSMPYAQIHYPFENKEKFEKNFPGDYIVEYIAQVRAWFYVMHALSTAIFDKNSFRNVITTGVMSGNDGRKMSKTFGNYADPKNILETIGGDALRLYLMGSPLMLGENANFDEVELKNKLKNTLNPLWNCLNFFMIHAQGKNYKFEKLPILKNPLDEWIVARLKVYFHTFVENIEAYLIPPVVKATEEFVDDLSRWYVRRSREAIASDNTSFQTLFYVLDNFSKIAAPLIPFMSEAIYQNLSQNRSENKLSVHLETYPQLPELSEKESILLRKMESTRNIVALALSSREQKALKIRQPLSRIYIKPTDENSKYFSELIADEVNVHEVIKATSEGNFADMPCAEGYGFKVYLDTNITEELKQEGYAREFVRSVQSLRKEQNLNVSDKIELTYDENSEYAKAITLFEKYIMEKTGAVKLIPSDKLEIQKA